VQNAGFRKIAINDLCPAGRLKLTINSVNPDKSGSVPFGTFEFSINTGSSQGYHWSSDKEYVDCSFSGDLTKGAKTLNITGSFRVWHPQAGRFMLRKGADGQDPESGQHTAFV
jgi:hypothetical protein